MTDAVSAVPGIENWSYGSFEFDADTGRRTVPLVRDDGKTAMFTIPEFVNEPRDLDAIARIVIAACHPTRFTEVTSPTVTSSTITGERGTTLRMSWNSALTSNEWSSSTGEPGSGRS